MRLPFIEAGEIVNTHGVRGEIKMLPWLDSPEDMRGFTQCRIGGKVELRLEEDGLAAMILSDEDLDRLGKSYTTQVHDGLAEYYDGVVEDLADEMEISTDELKENYGVKDNAGVFEAENDMTMGEFEKKLAPTKVISDLQSLYNGSGVVVTGDDGIRIRFPDRTWEVDASQDGKLILTSDELQLTFMKNVEEQ